MITKKNFFLPFSEKSQHINCSLIYSPVSSFAKKLPGYSIPSAEPQIRAPDLAARIQTETQIANAQKKSCSRRPQRPSSCACLGQTQAKSHSTIFVQVISKQVEDISESITSHFQTIEDTSQSITSLFGVCRSTS